MQKYETFRSLAADLQPTLKLDHEELDREGFTQARHSRQFAAIIEVMVCELYSMLDGVRYALFAVYQNCRGVQQGSTSKLFSRAASQSYGPEFPEPIRLLLSQAHDSWFFELRRLRTAFTHGGLGSCALRRDTGQISYINSSLGTSNRSDVIDDIVSHVNPLAAGVSTLLEGVFNTLYSQLEPIPKDQLCGIYKHRFYMRTVAPTADLNRASGTCKSRPWFDAEPEFRCPLSDGCQAYARAAA